MFIANLNDNNEWSRDVVLDMEKMFCTKCGIKCKFRLCLYLEICVAFELMIYLHATKEKFSEKYGRRTL